MTHDGELARRERLLKRWKKSVNYYPRSQKRSENVVRREASDIKPEVNYIALLHDVVPAFET
jgi:hypothetical protein